MKSNAKNCSALLDELEELIDNSAELPLSGGRVMIKQDVAMDLIQEIRARMPHEISNARAICAERERIIADAQNESHEIIRKAEVKARYMVDNDEMVMQAKRKSEEILANANGKAREIFLSSKKYSEEIFRQTDDTLNDFLNRVRVSSQNLKSVTYTDFVKITSGNANGGNSK